MFCGVAHFKHYDEVLQVISTIFQDKAGPQYLETILMCYFNWWNMGRYSLILGAQWLSGRVLDLRPRPRGFEPHRRHCILSLSKTH